MHAFQRCSDPDDRDRRDRRDNGMNDNTSNSTAIMSVEPPWIRLPAAILKAQGVPRDVVIQSQVAGPTSSEFPGDETSTCLSSASRTEIPDTSAVMLSSTSQATTVAFTKPTPVCLDRQAFMFVLVTVGIAHRNPTTWMRQGWSAHRNPATWMRQGWSDCEDGFGCE